MHLQKTIIILLLWILPLIICSQDKYPVQYYTHDKYIIKTDSLKEIYGYRKILIPEYELPALIALSSYPELDSTTIVLKTRRINKLGNVRPKADFIFRKPENRHYIIIVNKNPEDILGFSFFDIPFNAQIGFFSHELAHITDYSIKSNCGIVIFGLKYFLTRKKVERHTDNITIEHGCGKQLYDLNMFIRSNPDTNPEYIKYREKYYLSPEEILDRIKYLNNN